MASVYLAVPEYTSALRYNLANKDQTAALSALPYSFDFASNIVGAISFNSVSIKVNKSALWI